MVCGVVGGWGRACACHPETRPLFRNQNSLLDEELLAGVPVLVFANKQDQKGAHRGPQNGMAIHALNIAQKCY